MSRVHSLDAQTAPLDLPIEVDWDDARPVSAPPALIPRGDAYDAAPVTAARQTRLPPATDASSGLRREDQTLAMMRMAAATLLHAHAEELDAHAARATVEAVARGDAAPQESEFWRTLVERTPVVQRWAINQEAADETNAVVPAVPAISALSLMAGGTAGQHNRAPQTLEAGSAEELAMRLMGLKEHHLASMQRSVDPLLPLAAHEALLLMNAMPKEERAAARAFLAPHVCTSLQSYALEDAIRLVEQLPGPHAPYVMTSAALRLLALKPSLSKRATKSGLCLDLSLGYPNIALADLARSAAASPWFSEQTRRDGLPLTTQQSLDAFALARSGEAPAGLYVRFEPSSLTTVPMTELLLAVERSAWLSQNLARAPIVLTDAQTRALLELVETRSMGKELPFVAHAGTIQRASVSSLLDACERAEGFAPMLRATPKLVEASDWPANPNDARALHDRMAPYAVAFAPGASLAPMALPTGGYAERIEARRVAYQSITREHFLRAAERIISAGIENGTWRNGEVAIPMDMKEMRRAALEAIQAAYPMMTARNLKTAQRLIDELKLGAFMMKLENYFADGGWRDVRMDSYGETILMEPSGQRPAIRDRLVRSWTDEAKQAAYGAVALSARAQLARSSSASPSSRGPTTSRSMWLPRAPSPRTTLGPRSMGYANPS